MIGYLAGVYANIKAAFLGTVKNAMASRAYAAALNLPLAGAVVCVVSGVFIAKNWGSLNEDVKLGVAAQFMFPLVFLAGSAVRYALWFAWLEGPSLALGALLSAYMYAAYAIMLFAAFSIFTGRGFRYWRMKGVLLGFAEWLFS